MTAGHLGEWLAAQVFDVQLEPTATARAIDGRFRSGPLAGRTVNVKWYLKREGLLDVSDTDALDHYLVFTGPTSPAMSTRGGTRPWCIEAVYLFDARRLLLDLRARGVKIGVASSVRRQDWDAAEIYPTQRNNMFGLEAAQSKLLRLFRSRSTP